MSSHVLLDKKVDPAVLINELAPIVGRQNITVFSGESLNVGEARDIVECLAVPPRQDRKAVCCVYDGISSTGYMPLLKPLEELSDKCLFVLSCFPPFPTVLESRLTKRHMKSFDYRDLYEKFALISRDEGLDSIYASFTHLTREDISHRYDSFMQCQGQLSMFVNAVHDGNREAVFKVALGCSAQELEFLFMELDLQLIGKSLSGKILSRISRDQLLRAVGLQRYSDSVSPKVLVGLLSKELIHG